MSTIINKFVNKNSVATTTALDSSDPIKRDLGNYYLEQDQTLNVVPSNPYQNWVWDVSYGTPRESGDNLFPGKTQKITMEYVGQGTLKDEGQAGLKAWLLENYRFNQGFTTHNVEVPVPVLDLDPEKFSNSSIDVESFYNYEFFNYESLSETLNSNSLPGFMLFDYAEQASSYDAEKSEFVRSYNNTVAGSSMAYVSYNVQDNNDSNLYLFNRKDNSAGIGLELKRVENNYFKLFTDSFLDDPDSIDLATFETKNSNVFVHYKPQNVNLDYLPHWNKIRIPKLKNFGTNSGDIPSPHEVSFDTTKVDDALNKSRLIKFLFSYIKNSTPSYQQFYHQKSGTAELKRLKTWNMTSWWQTDSFDSLDEGSDEMFLLSEEDVNLMGPRALLERRLRKVIALGMMRKTVANSLYDFEDLIIKNKLNAKSIIGYKIEKFLSSPTAPNRTPIQTFYFESNGDSPVELIDTQVSFDTKYYYSISALTVVIGSTYSYRNLETKTETISITDGRRVTKTKAEFDFVTNPSLRVIELPLEEVVTRIVEPPPLRPHVTRVANEKFVKNKIKFFIQDSFGNVYDEHGIEKFIRILDKDDEYYQKLIESYNREDERFFYSSRAATGFYEVFRLEQRPETYLDFKPGFIGTIQNDHDRSIDAVNSGEFVDFIEHDKKYYYLFRAITPHDRSSNPSAIFEVQLIPDADEVKLSVSAFHLKAPEPKKDQTVSMRRFLQIVPNQQHIAFNPENNPLPEEHSLQLGVATDGPSLFGEFNDYAKKFIKLRLTSKTNGKKIDLNLKFKVKSEATES